MSELEILYPIGKCLWFGCDYLRLCFGHQYESGILDNYFSGLSANSNELFNVTFFGVDNLKFNAIFLQDRKIGHFSYNGTAIIQITKMLPAKALKNSSWLVDFYSSIFHIPELLPMIEKMLNLWRDVPECRVSRIDLAADLVIPVEVMWKKKITNFSKINCIWGIGGHLETFYLGRKEKNKKHWIRVYDKKIDSQKKGKYGLYGHYITMSQPVTRCEAELHVQSCDQYRISLIDILDFLRLDGDDVRSSRLFAVFLHTCGNQRGTSFYYIQKLTSDKVPTIKIFRPSGPKNLAYDLDKFNYARCMLGYAQNLKDNGFDPVKFIVEHLKNGEKGT